MLVFSAIVILIFLILLSDVRLHVFIYEAVVLRFDFLFFRITYRPKRKKRTKSNKFVSVILSVVSRPLRYLVKNSAVRFGQVISVHSSYASLRRSAFQYLLIPYLSLNADSFEKVGYYSLDEDMKNDIYNVYLNTQFIFLLISLIILLYEAIVHTSKSRGKYGRKQIKRNNQGIS